MSLLNFISSFNSNENEKSEFEISQIELFDYLNLSLEQKNGLMFLLGMILPISAFNSKVYDASSLTEDSAKATEYVLSLLKQYSNSSHNWEGYQDELDLNYIQSRIYNFNFIYWKCLKKSEESIDDLLRNIPELDITVGKTPIDTNWVQLFFDSDFNMKNVNRLYYDFIENIGDHTLKKGLTQQESLAAGFAFYNFILPKDIQGSHFLISTISESCTPLFTSLQEYPILFKFNRNAFNANHIFSSIFQFFTLGIDKTILGPIHTFHQFLFYENGTSKFRDVWDFSKLEKDLLIAQTFQNAITIRQTNLFQHRSSYLESKEIFNKQLIDVRISKAQFINEIESIIERKYGYDIITKNLSSNGEFMELIAILFYETCLHSMVISEFED